MEKERERTRGWAESERARVAVERSRVAEAASEAEERASEAEERAARDLTALQVCLQLSILDPFPIEITTKVDRISHSREFLW